MLIVLPVLFFLTISLGVNGCFKAGLRISLLISAILTGVVITFLTEIASIFHSFSFYPIVSAWIIAVISSLILGLPYLKSGLKVKPWNWNGFNFDEQVFVFFIGATLLITFITALVSTPNTWDSMTYHLARVEHWLQDKTIAYYPTHIIRQLYYCPWAEFAIAHLRLLCPLESIVNLVQWTSMAIALAGVSLIAKQLGASRRGQLIAGLAAVTLPMGILQSVSTQTDYVETCWLLCFIFFVNEIRRQFRLVFLFSAGLSLGLALLTKGYGYILMVPFLILLIGAILGQSKRIQKLLIITFCVLVLNIGYYERNLSTFGSLTSPQENLVNVAVDFKVLAGNLLRNFGVEFDTPYQLVNREIPMGLQKMAVGLGIDFVHDPQASISPYFYQDFHGSETYCGNYMHMILFVIIFLLCWLIPQKSRGLRLYTLLICCAGILFCMIVRFQYWVTRFHLPLFIMFCPVFGVLMERLLSPKWIVVLGEILLFNAILFLFFNPFHPWFGPVNIWQHNGNEQYFNAEPIISRSLYRRNYIEMADQIRLLDCREVGLVAGSDFWEYPLWGLMKRQEQGNHFRIEHMFVRNKSAPIPYPLGDFNPCAVLEVREKSQVSVLLDKQYKKTWGLQNPDGSQVAVYSVNY